MIKAVLGCAMEFFWENNNNKIPAHDPAQNLRKCYSANARSSTTLVLQQPLPASSPPRSLPERTQIYTVEDDVREEAMPAFSPVQLPLYVSDLPASAPSREEVRHEQEVTRTAWEPGNRETRWEL